MTRGRQAGVKTVPARTATRERSETYDGKQSRWFAFAIVIIAQFLAVVAVSKRNASTSATED